MRHPAEPRHAAGRHSGGAVGVGAARCRRSHSPAHGRHAAAGAAAEPAPAAAHPGDDADIGYRQTSSRRTLRP